MDQITIRTVPDGDGVWQVHLEIQTDTFWGKGWCWGGPDCLGQLAVELTSYPLVGEPSLRLGYGDMRGDDQMLLLSLRAIGKLGAVEARVEIADADDSSCRLRAKLFTSYAGLDRFVPQLRALASGTNGEAILVGE